MASTKQIEDYLQKIRRLPYNKLCANCRAPSRLGFTAVCVKYGSFVCDLCKSAHQSYSHRTKSVTMSTWTMDEVKALDEKNGGGNEWCRAKWFAKMSESDQARYVPKEGDPLDNYKRFVLMAYEESRWYDANGKPENAGFSTSALETKPALGSSASPPKKSMPPPKVRTNVPVPVKPKPSAADEDLLILDFEAKVTVTPPLGVSAHPVATAAVDAHSDDWGAFATPATVMPKTSRLSLGNDDDWGFQSAPVVSVPPFQAQQMPPTSAVDPFAALYAQQPAISMPQPQPQQPSFGFAPMQASSMPMMNAFPAPRGTIPSQPQAPSPGMMMMMGVPPMQKQMTPPVTISDDPFSHLHSFHAPPANLGRTASAPAPGMSHVPPVGMNVSAPLARAASAPTANDPFAGLF